VADPEGAGLSAEAESGRVLAFPGAEGQEAAPASADAPAAAAPSDGALKALGTGLAFQMAQGSFAQQLAEVSEGSRRYGRFNAEEAFDESSALNDAVLEAKRRWESLKERTAAAKKEFDAAVLELTEHIARKKQERDVPPLDLEGAGPLDMGQKPKACLYTQKTGLPCRICRQGAIDSDPASEEHLANAEELEAGALGEELEKRDFFLALNEIEDLAPEVRAELRRWLDSEQRLPELFSAKAHVADKPAPADSEATHYVQRCARCGAELLDQLGEADEGYSEGAFVGLNCEGARDVARPISKRGSKRKKKANPEAEREEQAAAGAELAAAETVTEDSQEAPQA
jgi:hypothetical protein